MNLAYQKLGGGDDFAPTIFIYAADVKLPYAFTMAEEARAGVAVNPYYDYIEAQVIIVSDPKWADSTKACGFDYGPALKFAGGKEKVQQMIKRLLQGWKEYHRD